MRGKWARRVLVVGVGACAVVAGFALLRAVDGEAGGGTDRPAAVEAGGAPRSVAVRPTGASGELRVTWSAPAGPAVTSYRVAVEGGPAVEVAAPATTAVVTGLADEEAASVVVTARVGATEEPAAPVRGTPRSIGPGGCSGATITWDGGAGTTAWTTATNWDLDRVPTTTDHVCIPDGTTVAAPNPRPTVLSLASGGTLSLPAGIALTDTATPSLLSDTTWPAGTIGGSVVVAADGDLVASTTSTKTLQAHLVVDGTLRLDGTGTTVTCAVGAPSGVDVAGTLDLAANGTILQGVGTATCTPTVQVRAGGALDKVAGTGTSTVQVAVAVAGEARATTGTLALAGGSEHVGWTGTGSGASDGATTGTVTAATGAVVQLGGTGGRRTWHVAPGGVLAGAVTVGNDATLAGAGAVHADAVVRVTGSGQLAADLAGGTVRLEGGEWHGDVLPGAARVWQSGSLRGPGVTVGTGATVAVTGSVSVQTALVNEGSIDVTTGSLAVVCSLGQPSGVDNRGVIDLDRDGTAVTGSTATGTGLCTATIWNRSTGTVRKEVGTGTATVEVAVVNHGRVEATSGPIVLRGGSETVSWNGATTGTGAGPLSGAGTGTYVGTAPGIVRLQGLSSTNRRVHRVAAGSSLAGVEVEQYGTLGGDGTVAAGATLTIDSNGALAANLGGGTIRLAGGEWRGDVLVGEAREWVTGSVRGDQVKVRGGATVRVLGSVDLRTNLLNRGTVRLEASRLDVGCTPGTPSGLDNEGTVEVLHEGTPLTGTTTGAAGTCTSTLWNRADGILRKPSGTSTSTVQVAVVNDGIVTAHTGTLALVGGSAHTGWNGATSGPGSETSVGAGTGIYRSNGTAVLRLGGLSSTQRRTHTLALGAAVNGAVEVGAHGTLAGAATVGSAGSVAVAANGVLEADLTGGAVRLAGGILRADVGAGSTHTWATGTVEAPAAVVPAGATVEVVGVTVLATELANHGTIRFPATSGSTSSPGKLSWSCAPGVPRGLENLGLVETLGSGTPLDGTTTPGACTSTLRNRPAGTFRQAGVAVVGTVGVAVVNEGAVVVTAGTLRLAGGTTTTDAAGVTSTGAATGSFHSTGSAEITMIDGSSEDRTYHLAGAELGGLVESSADLAGWGTVASSGTLVVVGGTLDAELAGGTVRMVGGVWRADVLPGEHREWDDGDVADEDEIEVRTGATLTVTGETRLDTQVVNHGTVRLEARLRIWCRTGLPSGVDNRGLIDVAALGPIITGIEDGCTPTVQNRAGATVRKTGAGWSALDVALVNHGLVHAQAGDLALRGGSVSIDWDGSATGLDPGAATGEYRGDPGQVSLEGGEGCCGAVDLVSTHHLAPAATISGVMDLSAAVLEGSGILTEDAVVTVSGGTLSADLGGGTIILDEGVWAADVLPGVAREWRYGSLRGEVEVHEDASVLLDQSSVRLIDAQLLNRGLVRVEGAQLVVRCTVGAPAGIDNHGEISLGTNGWVAASVLSSTDCTPTVWNRPTGTIVADGTEARFGPALVNEGEVVAEAGMLSLEGGTEWESWDGTPGTFGVLAPSDGEWRGEGGTLDLDSASPCCDEIPGHVYRLRSGDVLAGDLVLGDDATMTGPSGLLQPGSLLTVDGGTLDMSLAGGTIVVESGAYTADHVLFGELTEGSGPEAGTMVDRSRLFRGGSLGSTEVVTAATARIAGDLFMPDGSHLEVRGTVVWGAEHDYPVCDACSLHIVLGGYLDVERDPDGGWWQMATVHSGEWNNDGTVRVRGEFPGVDFGFGPGAEYDDKGMLVQDISVPAWLQELESSGTAAAIAEGQMRGDLLASLLRDAAAAALDDIVVGQCRNLSANIGPAVVTIGICTVTDGSGDDAVVLTLGGGAQLSFGTSSFLGLTFDAGAMAAFSVGAPPGDQKVHTGDLEGMSSCLSGSVTFLTVGFTGNRCIARQAENPYSMDADLSSLNGTHTQYAGITWSPSPGEIEFAATVAYSIVIDCDATGVWLGAACPVPPEVEAVTPDELNQTTGVRQVTIEGNHLEHTERVTFVYETPSTTIRCTIDLSPGSAPYDNGTIDAVWDTFVVVTLPNSCPIEGVARVIVETQYGGDSEGQRLPSRSVVTFHADVPP